MIPQSFSLPGTNKQTVVIDTVSSVSYKAMPEKATVPDYDEIKDELCTEKSSEKSHLGTKSSELTKSSNYYFTLENPQEEHESISNVVC